MNLCSSTLLTGSFLLLWYLCLVLVIWWWCSQNEFGSFPSSGILLNSFRGISVNSSQNVLWNLPVKPSIPGLFFIGNFKVIVSFSVIVKCLWLACSYSLFLLGSYFGDRTFLRICPFHPGCSFYSHTFAHSSLFVVLLQK